MHRLLITLLSLLALALPPLPAVAHASMRPVLAVPGAAMSADRNAPAHAMALGASCHGQAGRSSAAATGPALKQGTPHDRPVCCTVAGCHCPGAGAGLSPRFAAVMVQHMPNVRVVALSGLLPRAADPPGLKPPIS